jgi:hypothetical protein
MLEATITAAKRLIRAVQFLARDGRIPRPLRGLAPCAVLPAPGPFDEAVLLMVGAVLWALYRDSLKEAWAASHPSWIGASADQSYPLAGTS